MSITRIGCDLLWTAQFSLFASSFKDPVELGGGTPFALTSSLGKIPTILRIELSCNLFGLHVRASHGIQCFSFGILTMTVSVFRKYDLNM